MPNSETLFTGGDNIALKVPSDRYAATVAFYRDVLGLPSRGREAGSETFAFGSLRLWLDEVPSYSQTDVWLQLDTPDLDAAMQRLAAAGVHPRDELEPLDGVEGHWVSDPAGVVHLVRARPPTAEGARGPDAR